MYGITAATGDRIIALKRTLGNSRSRWLYDDNSSVAISILGNSPSTILVEQRGPVILAAYGSAVHRVSAERLCALLEEIAQREDDLDTDLDLDFAAITLDVRAGQLKSITGLGQHRFFVDRSENGVLLSTSLGVVAKARAKPLAMNRGYEDFMLGFGFFPYDHTPYEGIYESETGVIEDYSQDKLRKLSARAPDIPEPAGPDSRHPASRVLPLLEEAIDRQVGRQKAHAVLLGGFDSALVAALLRRRGEPVATYTFDFGSSKYNQANIDLVTRSLGTEHFWVPITAEKMWDHLARLPAYLNYPGAQPHYQLHTVLATERLAEHGFEHVFTGDGCDAAFLAYPTVNQRARLYQIVSKVPAFALHSILRFLSLRCVDDQIGVVARLGRSVLRAQLLPWPANAHLPTQYLDDVSLARIRTDPVPPQRERSEEIREKLAAGLEDRSWPEVAFHGNAATGASRAKVDGAIMTTGVAQSTPFFDPTVKHFLGSLHLDQLRPEGYKATVMPKSFLSRMAIQEKLLPEEVVTQPKGSPVTSPLDQWYAGPLRAELKTLLRALPFECNWRAIDRLLDANFVESMYRDRFTLGLSITQPIGLLASYAAFCRWLASED
jgi:asparagine synthetase B (glutamine-hydrolysing)